MIEHIVIIGAGNLGTSLAQIIAPNVRNVTICARRASVAEDINVNCRNSEYFPTFRLEDNIHAISSFNWEGNPEIIFFCVPSSSVREVSLAVHYQHEGLHSILVSTSKGIEYPSLMRMSQIIEENTKQKPVVFSGPTFASEMIHNSPTAVTIAGENPSEISQVQKALSSEFFVVEICDDVLGVEFCSILKNIYSIAFGICEGIDINENARYAVFTKSFQEMKKIVHQLGGDAQTVDCFCGFGDLTLTSASRKSRNYTLGLLYGKKIVIDENSSGILFEGKKSILGIKQLCKNHGLSTPVLDFVYSITIEKMNSHLAFRKLWNDLRIAS